jgi:hypothetical protein
MASEHIQAMINYEFANIDLLRLALRAAHRSDEEGISDDGNRLLAKVGLHAIEMVETHSAIVEGNGTRSRIYRMFLCYRIAKPNRGRE